jgi:hypothetical protein
VYDMYLWASPSASTENGRGRATATYPETAPPAAVGTSHGGASSGTTSAANGHNAAAAAQAALQTALDRRDNGGDASALRGQ